MTQLRDVRLKNWTVDWRLKSFPTDAFEVAADEVAAEGWTIHENFLSPVAVLDADALEHNLALMGAYCAERNVRIAPHGKTTMSPELVRMQLDSGAWGMTAATAWQARMLLEFGASRVILANECVDAPALLWLAQAMQENPAVEILVFVDSVETVELMDKVLRTSKVAMARRVPVIIELGTEGGRAGARPGASVVRIAEAVGGSAGLELAGVGGFEGVIGGELAEAIDRVRSFLGRIRVAAVDLMASAMFRKTGPIILTAGGSAYFDQVADILSGGWLDSERDVEVVLRSGCYITHDHGGYATMSPFRDRGEHDFRPALFVWTTVVSVPEPGLAIVDAGKRDISVEGTTPVLKGRRAGQEFDTAGAVVDRFNDQHGFVTVPELLALKVGDKLLLGTSHPCVTFDKWRALPIVNAAGTVLGAVRTQF